MPDRELYGCCIIGQGVRQGCPLSSLLFNIYIQYVINEALEVTGRSQSGRCADTSDAICRRSSYGITYCKSFPSPRRICLKRLSGLHLPRSGNRVFLLLGTVCLQHLLYPVLPSWPFARAFPYPQPGDAGGRPSAPGRWHFHFRGPITGSLKIPCTTSYRSSIETIALNCLFFLENRVFSAFWRQTGRQRNRWTAPMH